ncbi:MAG: pyridoxamine 5'-phosphate oxidase family protein [Chloroflexota bacterium]
MTRSIGPALPAALLSLLDGDRLDEKLGIGIQCLTSTTDDWPYQALVSVGELVALSPSALRLAIWSTSTTAQNMEREGRCALALVHEAASLLIRCDARDVGSLNAPGGPALTVFDLGVVNVLEDVAAYATLTSGITFTLHDPTAILTRWMWTVAALRASF